MHYRLARGNLGIAQTIASGMTVAPRTGVAVSYVSPRNLFLARAESVTSTRSMKVLDFGLAHSIGQIAPEPDGAPESSGGLPLLDPAYAAPEQLERTVGRPGPWTDVYALALIVLEVLSDRVVMEGSEFAGVLDRVLDPRRRPTPQRHGLTLPPHIDAALTRAVSRAPEKRQKSAGRPPGQCIADTLGNVRIEPFADRPVSFAYRVYVAP